MTNISIYDHYILIYDQHIPAAGTFVFSGAIMIVGIIVHLVQMMMADQ